MSPTSAPQSSRREVSDFDPQDWKSIAVRVWQEFRSDHVTLTASGVAFWAFLSAVPLLAATVSFYGLIADPDAVSRLVSSVGQTVSGDVQDLMQSQLVSITSSTGGALGFGLATSVATTLWSASTGFDKLVEGLNIAYDTDDDTRSFWKRRLVAIGFAVGTIVLLAAATAVISFVSGMASGVTGLVLGIVGWIAVAVLFALGLAVLYRYAPARHDPQWEIVSIGSVAAVITWTAATALFGVYLNNFGSYNETYGALGAVVVALLWLYVTSAIIVIGAELNSEAEQQRLNRAKP